jgi:hypothetical protein
MNMPRFNTHPFFLAHREGWRAFLSGFPKKSDPAWQWAWVVIGLPMLPMAYFAQQIMACRKLSFFWWF